MIKKNKFTILIAMVIVYLSLAGSLTFGQGGIINIPYIDKIGHFGLYFILMSVIILEHKDSFQNTRQILLVALIPFFFGTLMEFLQMTITTDRKGEILDALSNSIGITVAMFLWLFFKPYYKQELRK
jgi:VanZ family protein